MKILKADGVMDFPIYSYKKWTLEKDGDTLQLWRVCDMQKKGLPKKVAAHVCNGGASSLLKYRAP